MIIYPAVDIRNGQLVRLYQGDFAKETIYNSNPHSTIQDFISAGTNWVHLVDLDGAKNPAKRQVNLIEKLIKNNDVNFQIGGGIRTKDQIQQLLDIGASRIIIGNMAIKNPDEVCNWLMHFGSEKLALALDVIFEGMEPKVTANAWQSNSQYSLHGLLDYYQQVNLRHVLCTDVSLDGTLKGPNYSLYESILSKFPQLEIQASGGVSSLSDIKNLRNYRIKGVIVGKALYENKFSLQEALSC
jgi:phosphoribosylformimino-5-aminoimidazole carboxamide ribotide isomerase